MTAQRNRQKMMTVVLVVLTVAVFLLTMLGIWLGEAQRVVVPAVQLPALPEEQSFQSVGFAEDDPVFTKPLFWASRRPPSVEVPPPEEVTETQATIDDIELLGVLIAQHERSALVKSAGAVQRLQTGDSVAGWEIESISEGQVTFVTGSERAVVQVVKPVSSTIRLGQP